MQSYDYMQKQSINFYIRYYQKSVLDNDQESEVTELITALTYEKFNFIEKALNKYDFIFQKNGIYKDFALCRLANHNKNKDEAFAIYYALAQKKYPSALIHLALTYIQQNRIKSDQEKGIALLLEAANLTNHPAHIIAQYNLATIYINGVIVKKNILTANQYLHYAAEHDFAPANYLLGKYLASSNSLEHLKYFQKAIEFGDSYSKCYLGWFNLVGEHDSITPNLKQAVKLLKQAAIQHYPPALLILSILYSGKCGVKKNIIRSKILKKGLFQLLLKNANAFNNSYLNPFRTLQTFFKINLAFHNMMNLIIDKQRYSTTEYFL